MSQNVKQHTTSSPAVAGTITASRRRNLSKRCRRKNLNDHRENAIAAAKLDISQGSAEHQEKMAIIGARLVKIKGTKEILKKLKAKVRLRQCIKARKNIVVQWSSKH